jgi:AbrB family looped-hinge helix DNA binding protein
MTVVTMSEKGQIIVPKDIRDQHGWDKGSIFAVEQSRSGVVHLRPLTKRRPKVTFLEALRRAVAGVEIPEIKAHCPPRL